MVTTLPPATVEMAMPMAGLPSKSSKRSGGSRKSRRICATSRRKIWA